MKQDWTEQLRQRLADYEEPAPDGLWEAIEQRLQEEGALLASQEQPEIPDNPDIPENPDTPDIPGSTAVSARRVPLRRWLAVAASVLVLLTAGVALLFQQSETEQMADAAATAELSPTEKLGVTMEVENDGETMKAAEAVEDTQTENLTEQPSSVDHTAKLLAQLAETKEEKTVVAPVETKEEKAVVAADAPIEPTNPSQAEPSSKPQDETAVAQKKGETAVAQRDVPVDGASSGSSFIPNHPDVTRRQSLRPPLTVGLRGANLLASNGKNAVSTSEPIYMARGRMKSALYANNYKDFEQDPIRLVDYADDTEHQHPFTVGLTLSIPLTDRLWVETGLSYTRAKSTFTTRMGRNTSVYHQRLQYVGVPLAAGYTFWHSRAFQLYGVGGVQADVNVDAHLETDGLERHLDKDRLLFSVGGRAGAEYRFLPHFGIYLEPGLRYYIDNGSRLQTVFKEKPLQLDFQMGVRYSLK